MSRDLNEDTLAKLLDSNPGEFDTALHAKQGI